MRHIYGLTILGSALLSTAAGCAPVDDDPEATADEAAAQGVIDGDQVAGAGSYFAVTADLRKCAFPKCGGWSVAGLNRTATRCHDGREAAACYTPVLDWSETRLSGLQQDRFLRACSSGASSGGVYAVVRGRFMPTNRTTPEPALGRFVISEAWVAEGDTLSDGVFVRVKDNGVRCFTSPCPSITETALNTPRSVDISGIDWAPAELREEQIAECIQYMSTPDGLVIAGFGTTITGQAGTAAGRAATAAYYRLSDAPE
jgi:hypothetical protein